MQQRLLVSRLNTSSKEPPVQREFKCEFVVIRFVFLFLKEAARSTKQAWLRSILAQGLASGLEEKPALWSPLSRSQCG